MPDEPTGALPFANSSEYPLPPPIPVIECCRVKSVTVHIYDITVREQATAARNQHAPRRLPNGDPILPDQLPVVRTWCKGLPALLLLLLLLLKQTLTDNAVH
uniref:Uncharacterized protein n=1 Tax=Anopheles melas TaxID=34690 RepID=A0A182TPS5_9DIPT